MYIYKHKKQLKKLVHRIPASNSLVSLNIFPSPT